ncbi:MAG TPA: aminotransferase class III-fold pyridoxal phosphate-dependent enzyme [Planctomycetaceae bacterium]|nr:aminotransferase class III-fold pyridoxal phosphate-dependent enzyme [Planctomycetaceae bacterium]
MSQSVLSGIQSAYLAKFSGSQRLYERALQLFPNGVTHDARYLEPFPIYVDRALGARKWDVDGNELVDYWMGHGALLLGHSHPAVVEAVRRQAGLATHPGACHELELEWGEWIQRLVPSAELIRFTNSGTEATLMALRVARIASGRTKVIKFMGHFHGWHDALLPAAEPPHDNPEYPTPGVTDGVVGDLVLVPPNDLAAVVRAIDEHRPACVIHEGNGAHWGAVPAEPEFLRRLRKLTSDKQVLLILDEVITGFRVAPGGFQEICGIEPDLSTFAKVLAGGLPGGCLAGRADIMEVLAFNNRFGQKMKHPGTYNGNPLSAAAGCAALSIVATQEPCRIASEAGKALRHSLNELFERKSVNWISYGRYSAVKILPEYEGPRPSTDDFVPYGNDYRKLDRKLDPTLSHAIRCALLLGGVDWMGWSGSTSSAHNSDDLERTVGAFAQAIDLLRGDGLLA